MSKLGTVYKIEYKDEGIIYIGSTLEKFNKRINKHLHKYKGYLQGKTKTSLSIYHYFDEFGIDNFKFEKIKEYKCCDKNHLFAYEQLYINKTDCVNIQNPFRIPYLSQKKSDSEYYEKNREKIKKRQLQYYEKNKDKNREKERNKQSEYYAKNKEKILKKRKEYYEKNKIKR